MIGILKNIWCFIMHRNQITRRGSGEWWIYHCSICDETWPEPRP